MPQQVLRTVQDLRPQLQAIAQQALRQALLQEAEIEEQSILHDDEEPPPAELPEPHELEETGVSELCAEGGEAETPFDEQPAVSLPRLQDLPRRARPPVMFRISADGSVDLLPGARSRCHLLQRALAEAIAAHLKRCMTQEGQSRISDRGRWPDIPAIGFALAAGGRRRRTRVSFHQALVKLAPAERRAALAARLRRDAAFLYSFALMLPCGDVITPAALAYPARAGKKATRAGALRMMSERPSQLAGESWSAEDWSEFARAQNVSARRASRKASREGTVAS